MTTDKFCKYLNELLLPVHADLESRVVDPKLSGTPYISRTVAWRFLQHLGYKYGVLHKRMETFAQFKVQMVIMHAIGVK